MKAFLLAGTHSGCGKTTLAAGLIRAFRQEGYRIAPFKTGPDYLDPKLLALAAGRPCWNLDGFFRDLEGLRDALAFGGQGADLALVEGVMGLFDGADPITFQGSGAALARDLGLPTVLVVDGGGAGGSIAATVFGHARLWPDLELAGVILNRLGGVRHFQLQKSAIETHTGIPVLGWIPKNPEWVLPERHLGIYQPGEVPGLEPALERLAASLRETLDLSALAALGREVPGLPAPDPHPEATLPVALGLDEAFSFAYPDTLDRMERLGVRWLPFSPLRERLPEGVAGLYLPGGYSELHAEAFSRNTGLHADLKAAHRRGLPILAECGGYMALGESLVDLEGRTHPMAGVIPGRFRMTERLRSFGYKRLAALQDTLVAPAGAEGKAHEFHHSLREDPSPNLAWRATSLQGDSADEGHAEGNLLATYCHLALGAQQDWARAWVARMRCWQSR
jgi:cobyrinic acid a,c-diamide synthase